MDNVVMNGGAFRKSRSPSKNYSELDEIREQLITHLQRHRPERLPRVRAELPSKEPNNNGAPEQTRSV